MRAGVAFELMPVSIRAFGGLRKASAQAENKCGLRDAMPEEIANAVAFLASDESSFMTAEHVSVDGGAQHF